MDPAQLKQLKIQTGVVKRIGKEKLSYRKEADQQKAKIEKMKQEGRDEIEIKKMNECMQESLAMIPDCHRRLEKAYPDLKTLVDKISSEEFGEVEEYQAAVKALEEAQEHLKAE